MAQATEDGGPFLQLETRCGCGRLLNVRPSLAFVDFLRSAIRATGNGFEGSALVCDCRDCKRTNHISAEDLYLSGVP